VKYVILIIFPLFISCMSSTTRFSTTPTSEQHDQSTAKRTDLINASKSWMGCPYLYGGTSRSGVDCSGLVQQIFKEVYRINLPRSTKQQFKEGQFVRLNSLNIADLVFFKTNRSAGVDHVGIYLGDDEFVHASTSRGVMISNLSEKYFKQRFAGARRIIY